MLQINISVLSTCNVVLSILAINFTINLWSINISSSLLQIDICTQIYVSRQVTQKCVVAIRPNHLWSHICFPVLLRDLECKGLLSPLCISNSDSFFRELSSLRYQITLFFKFSCRFLNHNFSQKFRKFSAFSLLRKFFSQ